MILTDNSVCKIILLNSSPLSHLETEKPTKGNGSPEGARCRC